MVRYSKKKPKIGGPSFEITKQFHERKLITFNDLHSTQAGSVIPHFATWKVDAKTIKT